MNSHAKNTPFPSDNSKSDEMADSTATIGMMAKFWQSGMVKTRLGAKVGMKKSAELHRIFVHHLIQQLSKAPADMSLQWVLDPPQFRQQASGQLEQWNSSRWQIIDQGDGDLGKRMERWFRATLTKTGFEKAILIGADCPLLTADDLCEAMSRLDDADVVLGPAPDGGYYLIGLRAPWQDSMQHLFAEIQWSEEDVFEITCRRIKEIGFTYSTLPEREDIDTINELTKLQNQLARCENQQDTNQQDRANADLRDEIERIMASDKIPKAGQ